MSNTHTFAGAAATLMLSALLTYAALEPVSVRTAAPAPGLASAAAASAHG